MKTHSIEPERRALHGSFSRDFAPILEIDSGDSVVYSTLDASWSVEPRRSLNPEDRTRKFEPRNPETDSGHALCGPIFVRGARPGMTLSIQIEDLKVGSWGWSVAGGWDTPLNRRLGVADTECMHVWTLDADRGTGRNQYGHEVALRPFMGVLGMPPDEPGVHSTGPPRATGGNIDCKELVAGTTLYLPIAVEGGLFSVGDGHAAQGDGEVSGTAIECPMERVRLKFILRDDMPLSTPRAETSEGWLTFGFHEDLDEAMAIAISEMIGLMQQVYGISRNDALALASLVVDLRITQVVNGVRGVHAVLPHDAIRAAAS
ncbi:MAG TPA: acetamidase/formamidase family protein [Capsulimonadaceae bacterium]|nr:acetamidase/formamidase family protein [Capsulimonadaceae bacterium]